MILLEYVKWKLERNRLSFLWNLPLNLKLIPNDFRLYLHPNKVILIYFIVVWQ